MLACLFTHFTCFHVKEDTSRRMATISAIHMYGRFSNCRFLKQLALASWEYDMLNLNESAFKRVFPNNIISENIGINENMWRGSAFPLSY